MSSAEDFKRISVPNIRKMIKDLGLKTKNKNLKGYSYKKKKDLINELMTMGIPESELVKYRKPPKIPKTKAKASKVKNIQLKVEPATHNKFQIIHIDSNGKRIEVESYKSRTTAMKRFKMALKMMKHSRFYLVMLLPENKVELLRSSMAPNLVLDATKRMDNLRHRFKPHMMYKEMKNGKYLTEYAETYKEHVELQSKGYTHHKKRKQSNREMKAKSIY